MATLNSNINAPTEQTATTIGDDDANPTTNPHKSATRPSATKPNNNQSSGSKPPKRTKKKSTVVTAAVVKQEQQPAQNDPEKQLPSSKSTKKKKKAKSKNKSEGDDNGTNRSKDNNGNNTSSGSNPNVANRSGNSTNTPGRRGQPPSILCDCGKKFQTLGALRTHRENAKAHGPFRDRPAMVLMKALGEAPPALIEGARLNNVTVGGNGALEKDEGEVTNVHLCECGRVFNTWAEVYKHLPGSSVHTPGSQVAVYTGKARRRGEEGKDQEKEQKMRQEASSSSSSRKSKNVEIAANDTKSGGSEDRSLKGGVQCSCGKTLKDENALRNHQRQSAKHRSSPGTAASAPGDSGSKQKQTSTPNPISANQAAETKSLPSSSSAKKAKPPKPKHRSQRDRPGRSGGGGGGGGGGGSGGSSSSGYGYTSGNFGYDYGYGYGFGDGYDWGLCDKDCGWCGHCMDGVDI